MRETVNSLRAYFILTSVIGILITCGVGFTLLAALGHLHTVHVPTSLVVLLVLATLIDLALSVAIFYTGLNLPKLLRDSPRFIIRLLYVTAAWVIIAFLMTLPGGMSGFALARLVIGLLIIVYLWRNVVRLSACVQQPVTTDL